MKKFVSLFVVTSLVRTGYVLEIIDVVDISLQTAIKNFTPSLYAKLAKSASKDNFVFSPFGLHLKMTVLYFGTKNNSKSRQELGATLGIGNNEKGIMESYKNVIRNHRNLTSFQCGSHIWVDNDLTLSTAYKEMVTSYFNLEVTKLDFGGSGAVQEVNQWINKITENKGGNVISSFPYNTKMVTANALYLKVNWVDPFNDIKEDFNTENGKMNVDMIGSTCSQIEYAEVNEGGIDLTVFIIPYKDNKFNMQIILPKSVEDFNSIENYIGTNPEAHKKIFDEKGFTSRNVSLKIPIFKVESKFDAKEALQAMGIKDVFTSSADLDNIASGMPLMVSNVLHNSVVEVTKNGTIGISSRQTVVGCDLLVVNNPFVFIIYDTKNGLPVFVGRIKNPQSL